MVVHVERRRFTVDDFARMLRAGILTEDDRVELIDGEVRQMSPIGPLHTGTVKRLIALFGERLGRAVIVSAQDPVELTDYTEPQTDIALLRPRSDFYTSGHPQPDDVLLVIEVADTSLAYDRAEKLPRYAQAGIAEAWLIDLEQFVVTQFTEPDGAHYRIERSFVRGQAIDGVSIAGLHVLVDDILGPA
jgi:Uma2 family endonuclease